MPSLIVSPHDRVRNMEHFGFPVIEADSDPDKPFSVAQARNNAVRRAHGADVIIVADADVVPDIGSVHAALDNPRAWSPVRDVPCTSPANG